MACMGDRRGAYGVGGEGLRERDNLEDLGVKGTIQLRRNFKKWDWEARTGLICIRIGTFCGGACKCSNEISGSIQCREFVDCQRTSQLPKKDCSVQLSVTDCVRTISDL